MVMTLPVTSDRLVFVSGTEAANGEMLSDVALPGWDHEEERGVCGHLPSDPATVWHQEL